MRRQIVGSIKKTGEGGPKIAALLSTVWIIYVGKMLSYTKEDDLKSHFESNDINVARISKLAAKQEWQKKVLPLRLL